MTARRHTIEITDRRGPPRNPADPRYPDGMHVSLVSQKGPTCVVDLPYPAPERCILHVTCEKCGKTAALTAAGRADDPRTLRMSCKAWAH